LGTVPAWVGAIGTVLAFAVTFALLLLEIRLRRAQAADQEMRQARLVWVDAREEVSPSLVDPREEILRSADHFTITARPVVHNDSDETIRVLFVRVYDEFDQHLGVALAPGAALSPHSEVECLPLSVDVPKERVAFGGTSAELFFTDADGRRWKKGRPPDQALSRQLKD
jgi:hypothetical protein